MSEVAKKLVIVDDDKFLLDMYTVKFRESGFDVVTISSAQEVIQKMDEGLDPDVLLLDVVMPDMNGLELLKALKEKGKVQKAAIVILSNQGQASDIEEAKKLGIDGYIVKANTIPSEVLDQVNEILKQKKHE